MSGPGPADRVDPPVVSDEVAALRSWLDYHRATLRSKAAGLTTEQLRSTHPPSSLTLAGLLKHLAFVEDNWFSVVMLGRDYAEPWASADWDADHDWEHTSALDDSADDLRALLDRAVEASDAILDELIAADGAAVLDRLSERRLGGGEACDLRWLLLHMIEEYARHNGHADLIREAIDGATGE